jgi:TATA-box binding protein (TBP) (component of TFIID and TFIIIB)
MFEQLKTSTSTIVGVCDCIFDIDLIFSKIDVKDDITKIKCNNKEKTKDRESICKTFYNQITIHFDNNMNIKLFNNGKFQISGVKDEKKSLDTLQKFLYHIENIYGHEYVQVTKYNNAYIYKNRVIKPHEDGYICDNLVKNEKILIENKICEPFTLVDYDVLIQKTHTDKEKLLYNCFGENIGFVRYNMIRKNKNLCIKNALYIKKTDKLFEILKSQKYKEKIGDLEIVLKDEVNVAPITGDVKLYFRCCSKKPIIKSYSVANTNYNIKLKMDKDDFFDRNMFCDFLTENKIAYLFEPSKYPGVKLTLLYTKITIFRTGSILFSKGDPDVDMQNVINELENMFKKRQFIKTKQKISNEENNLTIWDLM